MTIKSFADLATPDERSAALLLPRLQPEPFANTRLRGGAYPTNLRANLAAVVLRLCEKLCALGLPLSISPRNIRDPNVQECAGAVGVGRSGQGHRGLVRVWFFWAKLVRRRSRSAPAAVLTLPSI